MKALPKTKVKRTWTRKKMKRARRKKEVNQLKTRESRVVQLSIINPYFVVSF